MADDVDDDPGAFLRRFPMKFPPFREISGWKKSLGFAGFLCLFIGYSAGHHYLALDLSKIEEITSDQKRDWVDKTPDGLESDPDGIEGGLFFEELVGLFSEPIFLDRLIFPSSAVLEDFDGNGDMDIAISVIGGFPNQIRVYLGNGDGTFDFLIQYEVGNLGLVSLSSGDLDSDGTVDLVATNSSTAKIFVYLGKGDGSFLPQSFLAGFFAPHELDLGDLDQDGDLDLVVEGKNNISLFFGDGMGNFPSHEELEVTGEPTDVKVEDVDRDGLPDLIVTAFAEPNSIPGGMSIFRGMGGGTFEPGFRFGEDVSRSGVAAWLS